MAGTSYGPKMSISGPFGTREKDRKIGHRRVDEDGQVTYKKVMYCILS